MYLVVLYLSNNLHLEKYQILTHQFYSFVLIPVQSSHFDIHHQITFPFKYFPIFKLFVKQIKFDIFKLLQ